MPESSLLFDSAFVCSLSALPLQALDTFVNHESIFRSVFLFFSWMHCDAYIVPVPKMIKYTYVLKQVKKEINFSLYVGFHQGINVHKDEYTNWGHFKKHSAKSL